MWKIFNFLAKLVYPLRNKLEGSK